MNRSIMLVTAAAALGLAACTSTPAPENNAATTTSTPSNGPLPPVTQVVTETVTVPPAKPVIDSFGYGKLKLGMTRQQAMDAKLIGPVLGGPDINTDVCTLHNIVGTEQNTWVSTKLGVASIRFTSAMSSDGVGVGATEELLKAEYTNLQPTGPNYSYFAVADGNPAAEFVFRVAGAKVTEAFLAFDKQDCHN